MEQEAIDILHRIKDLMGIKTRTHNTTAIARVKNVEFKISHVYTGKLSNNEVTVTHHTGFFRRNKRVVFNASETVDFTKMKTYHKVVRYLEGDWIDLIEDIA